MAAQGGDGLFDVIQGRAVAAAGAGQNLAEQVVGQVARIAGQVALQHEAQRLNLAAVIE
nr:hypothetical protein [Tanacetum cinerariifolium]